jgi:hypothetical protein
MPSKFRRDGETVRESPATRKLCRDLTALGAKVIAIVGDEMQEPGLPDRIIWHKRWRGWLEFKSHDGVVAPAQLAQMTQLNRRVPNSAWVVRCPGDMWTLEEPSGALVAKFHDAAGLLKLLGSLEDK